MGNDFIDYTFIVDDGENCLLVQTSWSRSTATTWIQLQKNTSLSGTYSHATDYNKENCIDV